jgi:hypothetical protein
MAPGPPRLPISGNFVVSWAAVLACWWTLEYLFRFCDIMNIINLLPSQFDFWKHRVLSAEYANMCWGATFGEVCQEHLEWSRSRCDRFLRLYIPLSWIVELGANPIRCFGLVPWLSDHQLRIKQSSISFTIIWSHSRCRVPLRFWLPCTFLFGLTREYLAFPGLYHSLIEIFILLKGFSVFLWDLYSVLSSSVQDICAIWTVSDFFGGRYFIPDRYSISHCIFSEFFTELFNPK